MRGMHHAISRYIFIRSFLHVCLSTCSGSALGALLGVYHGADKWPLRWREGLFNAKEIGTEADRFASLLVDTQTPRT